MPLRNPFKRNNILERADSLVVSDQEFSDVTVSGAKTLEEEQSIEYQLSEIDDSGVFIPPTDAAIKPSFWYTKSNTSLKSSTHRSLFNDSEPFSISRESFDSYRRSFDISACSPMTSLDSSRRSIESSLVLSPRPSMTLEEQRNADWPEDQEDRMIFEDVKLDENKQPAAARKRSIFARFSDSREATPVPESQTSTMGIKASHSFQLFTGRRRGQSGQEAELASMPRVMHSGTGTTPVVMVEGV